MKPDIHPLPRYFRTAVLIIALSSIVPCIQAQESCDQCDHPRIMIFDTEVSIPAPRAQDDPGLKKAGAWLDLPQATDWLKAALDELDQTKDCHFFVDAHMVYVQQEDGSTAKVFRSIVNAPATGVVEGPGFPDYIITGLAAGTEGDYTLTIDLQTAVSREVVVRAIHRFTELRSMPSYQEQYGYLLGKAHFIPLFQIIRDFEKGRRDEGSAYALGPDRILVDPAESEVSCGEDVEIYFELLDCDGVPLKGREILLQGGEIMGSELEKSTGGSFMNPSVFTDDQGKASAIFRTDDKPGKATIKVAFKALHPTGKEVGALGTCEIRLLPKPVEKLKGRIEARVVTHYTYPEEGEPMEKRQSETLTLGMLDIDIHRDRILYLQEADHLQNILSNHLQYGILYGKTARDSADRPNPILQSGSGKEYGTRFGEFLLEKEYETSGESDGCDWIVTIEPYDPSAGGEPVTALTRQYYLRLEFADNLRMRFEPGRYHTKGKTSGRERVDTETMERFSQDIDPGYPILPPVYRESSFVRNSYQSNDPMLIEDSRSLEEFLLHPSGSYTLHLKGRTWRNDAGVTESQYFVTLRMWVEED